MLHSISGSNDATGGNYAYLGAMKNGLKIFDISDKNLPVLRSTFIPSISYPDANPDPAKYNARGMAVKNNIVYLCYDAGGIRIINTTDKLNPKQTGTKRDTNLPKQCKIQ